jgi:protein gp37
MTETAIEWTDTTWNPTTGCDRISPGCDNCYALTMARRLKGMGSAKYQTDGDPRTSGPGFGLAVHEDALGDPLQWRKPRKVFVNSMSDLFHARVPSEFIAQVWAVMAATPQHTYQVLTKRPKRMARVLGDIAAQPLSNVWGGTSVENQEQADLRIKELERTPLAVKFLSCEPLLGPVALGQRLPSLDWVIVGGESGPGARRMEIEWASSLVRQCRESNVAVFVKQLGSAHGPHKGGPIETWPTELQVREYPAAMAAA